MVLDAREALDDMMSSAMSQDGAPQAEQCFTAMICIFR